MKISREVEDVILRVSEDAWHKLGEGIATVIGSTSVEIDYSGVGIYDQRLCGDYYSRKFNSTRRLRKFYRRLRKQLDRETQLRRDRSDGVFLERLMGVLDENTRT